MSACKGLAARLMTLDELIEALQRLKEDFPAAGSATIADLVDEAIDPRYSRGFVLFQAEADEDDDAEFDEDA